MELLQRIDALIEDRHLLRHSFYAKWVAGTLPMENLQEYARQYFAFESTFPRLLSALHSRCDDSDARAALLENLWDEEHGEANHQELWLRFAEGIGVAREDVRSAPANEGSRDLLETYWEAVEDEPVAAGIAAVYAYERQVPQVAVSKIDGLRRHYGVTDPRTLGFFEVHGELDVEHSEAERRMIARLGEGSTPRVLDATSRTLESWWGFLDAVDA
jgi:pyrroloquinoline-quinone synthase